jgi:hypothetical protein
MAHVKSTARPIGGASDSGGEDHGSERSEERTKFVGLSDVGSRGKTRYIVDSSQSFLFRPLSITISQIHRMISSGYFAEGIGRKPREETILDPHPDEAVVFEELFSAGLRMPPHPVLTDILLKF